MINFKHTWKTNTSNIKAVVEKSNFYIKKKSLKVLPEDIWFLMKLLQESHVLETLCGVLHHTNKEEFNVGDYYGYCK